MSDRDEGALSEPVSPALSAAIAAVEANPDDDDKWDDLDEVLANEQQPDAVAALMHRVLAGGDTTAKRATKIGQRAVRFYQEWFEDPTAAASLLQRVLQIDPSADWAFHRLTLSYTHAKRWAELLSLYDGALERTQDKKRRAELLDEASQVARDFAGDPERAIRYLEQLLPLRPADHQLAAALERLFERQSRHHDLIALWSGRLPSLNPDDARKTRLRIAGCWLDSLNEPTQALDALAPLFAEGRADAAVCTNTDVILSLATAPVTTRARARDLLLGQYAAERQPKERAAVLERARTFVVGDERAHTLDELSRLHEQLGNTQDALARGAELVVLAPAQAAFRDRLREMASSANAFDVYAGALSDAADAVEAAGTAGATALRSEAATVRAKELNDAQGAAALFERVLGFDGATEIERLEAARWLDSLYQSIGDKPSLLSALERRARLETEVETRCDCLARAARLADELAETDRSLAAWEGVLKDRPDNTEALDATVSLLDRAERWAELVEALRRRAAANEEPSIVRADLVRAATVLSDKLDDNLRSVALWTSVGERFGQNAEVVDALAALHERAGRWEALASLLAASIETETDSDRRSNLCARLGEAAMDHLGDNARALSCFRAALTAQPSHERARARLRDLSADGATAAGAVDALATAYTAMDEWEALLALLEARLAHADDASTRALLLLEAASTYEKRADDNKSALTCVCRAFVEMPEEKDVETHMLRLAEACGEYSSVAEAYRSAATSSPSNAMDLRLKCADVLETKVSDLEGALALYREVFEANPSHASAANSVVRVAGALGSWDVASSVIVRVAASGADASALLATFEHGAVAIEGWDGATSAMADAVAHSGLSGRIAHDLEARIGAWHRDRRSDNDRAQAAFARAVAQDKTVADTLAALAELQRAQPSSALVDTLLAYADATNNDLMALREAAELAVGPVSDSRADSILVRLYDASSKRWTSGDDEASSEHCAWALEQLVARYISEGAVECAVDQLEAGAALPFAPESSRSLRRRAGALCEGSLADNARAIRLFKSVFSEDSDDVEAGQRLAVLFESTGALEELRSLRETQLGRATDADARIALRLELARVRGLLDLGEDAEKALRENLAERPGHEESVRLLAGRMAARGASAELLALHAEQGQALEASDPERAQSLWARAAQIAEQELNDVQQAINAHSRVVALGKSKSSLDALALLHAGRAEHDRAVSWLEDRLALADSDEERVEVVSRLAKAYVLAGRATKAVESLEAQLRSTPDARELRALLAERYRTAGQWNALAELLVEGVEFAADDEGRVAMLREAADVFVRKLSQAARAVPVLERAAALAPSDRSVRVSLADARCDAGDLDGAREILEALLTEYGRRRPPERAKVHRTLARIARARGDLQGALAQLELASNIDLDDPGTLQMVGEVALELGEHERAANAYRSLLLVVRRHTVSEDGPGQAEVLFALHRIAKTQGQEDRASEVLETAFEAANDNEIEAQRFEAALLAAGEQELLLRALRTRLTRTTDSAAKARALDSVAATFEALNRSAEALDARLEALGGLADDDAAHEATRSLAKRTGQSQRYVDAVRSLAEKSSDRTLAARLLLRSGQATAEDLGDARAAVADLEKAHAEGAPERDVLRALDRAYSASPASATAALRAVLARRSEPDGPEDDHEQRVDALYRLAELDLQSAESRDEGRAALERALDVDARYDRAATMLARACGDAPDDVTLVALFEQVARSSANDATLLDALERSTALADASQDLLREAVEVAQRVGETARERALLQRAIERAGDSSDATWALVALGRSHAAVGESREAVELLAKASKVADASEAVPLGVEAAQLAADSLGDLALAASILEQLAERDASERTIWEPLLDVYRRMGAKDKLSARIESVLENVYDVNERNKLRVERARILAESPATVDDAATSLRACLEDDPGDVDAAQLLADLLEKSGKNDELDEFLRWQLDGARDRADGRAVVALSLRLATRWGADRRDDVIALYRGALDWAPADASLLRALLSQYGPSDDANDRADVLERLLECTEGDEAAKYALELADARVAAEDNDGAIRALDRGFKAAPQHAAIRTRLEAALRAADDLRALAGVIAFDAEKRVSADEGVARFREAAAIYRDPLLDYAAAAACIEKARALKPSDLALVEEHAKDLSAAGDNDGAAKALEDALASLDADSKQEPALRRARGSVLQTAGRVAEAVAEFELARSKEPEATLPLLLDALEAQRLAAQDSGEREQERSATTRLAQLAADAGDSARACTALEAWVEREPSDKDSLRTLATLHADAGRWDAVVLVFQKLADATEGEEKLDAVLRLAEACERAERLGDARAGLEAIFRDQPENEPVRAWLRRVYSALDAHSELAELSLEDAKHAPAEAIRFDRLRQAGKLFVLAGRNEDAIAPLEAALKLRAGDHESTVGLCDAYIAIGNIEAASNLLQTAINGHRNRRSAELGALQYRMARAAAAVGDQGVQLAWLNAALESDHQNGAVASELAELAMTYEDLETAMKALRALTLMKNPGPMSRAEAFYRQGVIAFKQGDPRKAAFLAKRALSEDAELGAARELLTQLGE
ncbi:MAG: tetratricopeptide repeat protein [Polyangiales bacterium]